MKYRHDWLTASVVLAFCSLGCSDRNPAARLGSVSSSGSAGVEAVTDQWLGQWNGPEGTFFKVGGG